MIGIHTVHRRLAEIHAKATRLGGYEKLSSLEQSELQHCLIINADLVLKLELLKQLAFQTHLLGDMDWQQDICKQIDELEAKLI